jgi:hypothetical protein
VRWQRTITIDRWIDVDGATDWTYETPALTTADHGRQYRAVVSNPGGSTTSDAALVRVGGAPTITQQPADQQVRAGDQATFSIAFAAEDSNVRLTQWQYAPPDGEWQDATEASARLPTYVTSARQAEHDGYRYRAVVRNAAGTTVSEVATLTVVAEAPIVTAEPTGAVTLAPGPARFTAEATSSGPMTVQWQISEDGSSWADIDGATSTTYDIDPTHPSMDGTLFRAVFRNLVGDTATRPAVLSAGQVPPVLFTKTASVVEVRELSRTRP